MTDNQKEFSKKVNIDKAINKTNLPIILITLSIVKYIVPLFLGAFYFELIFELSSLIFLIISKHYMSKYDGKRAKRYIIFAIVLVSLRLTYYLIFFYLNAIDFTRVQHKYSVILLTVYVSILTNLILIKKDLSKAINPIKYRETTDWFYEKYDEKKGGNKNV